MVARKKTDLCPDGLRIIVPWYDLHPGTSVFVPCINVILCAEQAYAVADWL